ncbi:MAG: primosomal protein N' [Lachnospiraceae bacterium]
MNNTGEEWYANIIIDISHEKVDRPFQYKIPRALQDKIKVGMEVIIPFGRGNAKRHGYVIEVTNQAECAIERLKEITDLVIDSVSLEANLIQLAGWMKETYGSTMIAALKTVLPAKQKYRAIEKKTVHLLLSISEAEELVQYYKKKHQVGRERLLTQLMIEQDLPQELITGRLQVPVKTIQAMAEQGILQVIVQSNYRNPILHPSAKEEKKRLSAAQQAIVEDVLSGVPLSLIHGITGSGKTEVYMEIIAGMIDRGKQAIVLIPEIALTYQTVLRFYKRFGERISVMNSKLSAGERYDQFERARHGELDIIIGPRSALFTPFSNLGVIIIDEEHENSYKSETMPRYHARETAIQIASMYGASVVCGSATPSLELYYMTKQGKCRLYELQERLTGGTLPKVYTVDLREELKRGNRSIFSRQLSDLIAERLESGQQSMLFLNRRGYAGFISCRACGHVMKCPHCDVSLSEHKNGRLTCHYCGYEEPMVSHCPKCGSKYITGFKAGTQQIVETLQKQFPGVRVLRMDADTTRTKGSYEKILSSFANGEADILVGTQMIVKGHDFPNVTLVGVLAADLSLCSNDYRAGERTFQLLTQAAGRAGRGQLPGEVVIQTYQPEHYSIVHAAKQDYKGFYEEEILYRELMSYPPIAQMMVVLISSKEEEKGLQLARKLATRLEEQSTVYVDQRSGRRRCQVVGPAKASIGKIQDIYRTVLYVKHPEYEVLITMKDQLELYTKTMELKTETIQFDFNPMNTY